VVDERDEVEEEEDDDDTTFISAWRGEALPVFFLAVDPLAAAAAAAGLVAITQVIIDIFLFWLSVGFCL
jgi:hypothetical protein